MKALIAAGAASFMAAPAFAGPYVNVETNAGYSGNDYDAATTELHVGYEGDIGDSAGYYVQAGPAIVAVDGEDTTTEFSGKAGVGVDIAENVNAYGEVSFITVDGSSDERLRSESGSQVYILKPQLTQGASAPFFYCHETKSKRMLPQRLLGECQGLCEKTC